MTEAEIRDTFAAVAASYLGCRQSDGTHREIIDRYNGFRPLPRGYAVSYSDPWCAVFVSAIAIVCGFTDLIPPECSCTKQIRLFEAMGRFEESDDCVPGVGDILYYHWNGTADSDSRADFLADHVGIVEKVSDGRITVIEGNCSKEVKRRTVPVGSRYVCGCAHPDFASRADAGDSGTAAPPSASASTVAAPQPKTVRVALPELCRGMKGEPTRAAQALLNLRGAALETDGSFGPLTAAAVKAFQRAVAAGGTSCSADGILGPVTWRALVTGA